MNQQITIENKQFARIPGYNDLPNGSFFLWQGDLYIKGQPQVSSQVIYTNAVPIIRINTYSTINGLIRWGETDLLISPIRKITITIEE